MSFEDGYARTLSALQRPGTAPAASILSSLSYYLAHVALPHPTTLTRAAVLSPLHTDTTSPEALLALADAFSSATRLRAKLIDDAPRGLFSRSSQGDLALWLRTVLEGTASSPELIKIAILGGTLGALHDLKRQSGRAVGNVENELVVAYATVLAASDTNSATTMRVLGARYLQYIPDRKISALELPELALFAFGALDTLYGPTGFTSFLSAVDKDDQNLLSTSRNASLEQALQQTNSDPQYAVLPAIARLVARCVSILADHNSRRLARLMDDLSRRLQLVCAHVESTWTASPLSAVSSESQLHPDTRPTSTTIWTAFKTLLFATTLIEQSILTVLIYEGGLAAPALGSIALRIFSSLAFVLAQFGGIAAAGGVPELRRAVFNALDVVGSDGAESDGLVRTLAQDVRSSTLDPTSPVLRAKAAYALACIEQLVPVLSDICLREAVVPLCEPHLRDVSHRETFEAAHSTLLAVFAWAAQRIERGDDPANVYGRELIPGYLQILLETTDADEDTGLRGPQLRLAIAAAARATLHEPALALLLVEDVLALPSGGASPAPSSASSGSSNGTKHHSRLRRGLMLAALLPAIPPKLLPRVLKALEGTVRSDELSVEEKTELGKGVYEEISERAGDKSRALLVRWWLDHAELFEGTGAGLEQDTEANVMMAAKL